MVLSPDIIDREYNKFGTNSSGETAVRVLAEVSVGDISITSNDMDAYGFDATGQDAYATVLTPSEDKEHIKLSVQGSNDVIVSLDGGTTDNIYLNANSIEFYDWVTISSGVDIQAKKRGRW